MPRERITVRGQAIVTGWTPEDLARKDAIEHELIQQGWRGLALEKESRRILAVYTIYPVHQAVGENALVDTGIGILLDAVIGTAITAFSNANSRLGVGDSTAAWNTTQTDLQAATNKLRKAMDATFPSRSGHVMTWRSTFATTDANFAWQEWAIFNAAASGTMLNRGIQNFGTKTSANAWQLVGNITLT